MAARKDTRTRAYVGSLTLSLMVSLAVVGSSHAQVNAFIETELGYGFDAHDIRKNEILVQIDYSENLTDNLSMTLIPRIRFDWDNHLNWRDQRPESYSNVNGPLTDNHHVAVELAEAYVGFDAVKGHWRLGKQQVAWGQADGLKVLDVVNPQDYRELNLDSFEQSRIATWLINGEFDLPGSVQSALQVLLIPDMTFNRLADRGAEFGFSRAVAPQPGNGVPVQVRPTQRPTNEWEAGLRWSLFVAGWDISVNYLNHYHDNPVVYRQLTASGVVIEPTYRRNNLYGFSASNAFDDWVVRIELAASSSSYQPSDDLTRSVNGVRQSPEVKSVLGIDYYGFSDVMVSYQWFQSHLSDYHDDIGRDRLTMTHTLMIKQSFWNETLALRLFALYDQQADDGELRSEVLYHYSDQLDIWVGLDVFYGKSEGLYGQFNHNDRVILGLKYGF